MQRHAGIGSSLRSFESRSMSGRSVFRVIRTLLLGGTLALAACSTTGNRFDTTDLRFLVPGETTLQEATRLLQGDPVNVYRQLDGSATARWAHTATLSTDAVYFNQELWLAFDAYGRFERIVKSNNVPLANLYKDGRRIDSPLPPSSGHVPALQGTWSAEVPQAVATPSSPLAASTEATPSPAALLPHTTVSYPLGR